MSRRIVVDLVVSDAVMQSIAIHKINVAQICIESIIVEITRQQEIRQLLSTTRNLKTEVIPSPEKEPCRQDQKKKFLRRLMQREISC